MKYFYLTFILFSCASHHKVNNREKPQLISIATDVQPSRSHNFVYDELVMNAPNYSVYQEHEGLKNHFNIHDDTSMLCYPSALATTLIQEKSKKAKNLQLKGFTEGSHEVDANDVVNQLVECTKSDAVEGTFYHDTANCISSLYKVSNLEVDVKLICELHADNWNKISKNVKHEQLVATIQDIIHYLKNDYQIIGILDFVSPNENKVWKREAGHAIVINGYARQKNWPQNLLYIFISDPSLIYSSSTYPRFDQALIVKIPNTKKFPARVGNLSFEGKSHMGLTSRAVLSGLIVYKTK